MGRGHDLSLPHRRVNLRLLLDVVRVYIARYAVVGIDPYRQVLEN